jgi:hypothetical protein
MGHSVCKQEAKQMGLLSPDEQPTSPTQFAFNRGAEHVR